jgi:hypothetical protein
MNDIRQAYDLRNELAQLYSYILIYAPDFPEEDQIDLTAAFTQLFQRLDRLFAQTRGDHQKRWLQVARTEAEEAFRAYSSGEDHAGAQIIQLSEEHVRNRFTKKAIRPTFLVGPGGETSKA